MYRLLLLFTGLILTTNVQALTRISIANGAWNNPAIWNPAGIPQSSDDTIVVNTTVSFTQNIIFGNELFHITTQGTLVDQGNDTCSFGCTKLLVEGYFETTVLLVGCTDSAVNRSHVLVTTDMAQSGLFYSAPSSELCVQQMLTTSDDFINEGSVASANWVNGAAVTGVNGQFCVYNMFINTDNISGTVDICDGTPGGVGDMNAGVIASTVTNCANGPCGSCLQSGVSEFYSSVEVSIMPHPVTAVSQMSFTFLPVEASAKIVITDITGRTVKSAGFQGNTWNLDRSGMEPGIYLYTLYGDATVLYSGKITVQ